MYESSIFRLSARTTDMQPAAALHLHMRSGLCQGELDGSPTFLSGSSNMADRCL